MRDSLFNSHDRVTPMATQCARASGMGITSMAMAWVIVLFVLWLSPSFAAAADEETSYTGSFCQPQYGSGESSLARTAEGGGVYIADNTSVICPIVQVNDTSSTRAPYRTYVQVYDAHSTTDIKCRILGYESDGTTMAGSYYYSSGTGVQTITVYSPGTPVGFDPESWAIECADFSDNYAGTPTLYSYWVIATI